MGLAYFRPDRIDDAAALVAEGGRVLAGGQSLMPLVKRGAVAADFLVDVNRLADLAGVVLEDGTVRIGALARLEELRLHPVVRACLPMLAAALASVANPAVRMRGTLVGNIVHNGPGAEAVAVAALARARLVCRIGARTADVPIDEFPAGALVLEVRLDASPPGTRAGFFEVQKRFGHLGTVGCGVAIEPDGRIRTAVSGLLDGPLLAPALDELLTAGVRDEAAIAAALDAARAGRPVRADLHADAEYRRSVVPAVVRRALARAEGRAP